MTCTFKIVKIVTFLLNIYILSKFLKAKKKKKHVEIDVHNSGVKLMR